MKLTVNRQEIPLVIKCSLSPTLLHYSWYAIYSDNSPNTTRAVLNNGPSCDWKIDSLLSIQKSTMYIT